MENGKGAAFFIRLNNHSEIRRAILESSKDAIMCLQRFERFREIREAKNEAIKQLSNYAIKIEKMSEELEKELPQFDSLDEMIKQSIESPPRVKEGEPVPEEKAEGEGEAKKEIKEESENEKKSESKDSIPPIDGIDDSHEAEERNELKELENSISQMEEKIKQMDD